MSDNAGKLISKGFGKKNVRHIINRDRRKNRFYKGGSSWMGDIVSLPVTKFSFEFIFQEGINFGLRDVRSEKGMA